MNIMLDFPQPCPSCDKKNENHWCYNFISKGELVHACKREGELLNHSDEWEILNITDKEGTPLKKPKPRKIFSPKGDTEYVYTDITTGDPVIKILRKDDGHGNKNFSQFSLLNDHWVHGTHNINQDTINLYQFEKICQSSYTKIYIVEGEKVAQSLQDLGIPATCVYGGPKKITQTQISLLLSLDKEIVLIPDGDKVGVKAMDYCRKKFLKVGIICKWILPFTGNKLWDDLPKDKGVDAYDWVKIIQNNSGFKVDINFLEKAEEDSADKAELLYGLKKRQAIEARNNALEDIIQIFKKPTITVGNKYYIWDGTHYERHEKWEIEQMIFRHMESVPIKKYVHGKLISILDPTLKRINDVYSLGMAKFNVKPDLVNIGGINCANGIVTYEIKHNNELKFKLVPHNPKRYFTYVSKTKYDPNASTEYFDKLMQCLDDFQSEILFRTLGASLDLEKVRSSKGRTIKSLIMQGNGSNGKDSLRQCLKLLMGGNLGIVSVTDFKQYDQGRKFAVSKLEDKIVNWCSENASVDLGKLQSLKAAITGEEISIEKKGKEEKSSNCRTTFIFNMNSAPEIKTDADAVISRFSVLKFDKTFVVGAKPSRGEIEADSRYRYDDNFLTEYVCPAFLNRMLKGLADVLKEGIDYSENKRNIVEIQQNTNHLWRFAEDVGLGYGDGVVTTKEIWSKLLEWYYEVGNVEDDDMGKKVWYDNPNPKDRNIKSINLVRARIEELFPKAKVENKRTMKQRTTLFNGLIFNVVKDDDPEKPDDNEEDKGNDNKPKPPSPPHGGTELSLESENSIKDWSRPSVVGEKIDEVQLVAPVKTITFSNPYKAVTIQNEKVEVDTTKIDIYNVPEKMNLPEFKPREVKEFQDLNTMILDIETTGLQANESEIISIGMRYRSKDLVLNRSKFSEKDIILHFCKVMKDSGAAILVGHNVYNFDLPFIAKRAEILDIDVPFRVTDFHIKITASSINGKPISYKNIVWRGVDIVDTFHLVGMYDKMTNSLSSYGLKQCAIDLKLREERRTELSYDEILDNYKNSNWEIIDEYLIYDLEDTELLNNLLLPQIYYQSMVVPGINLQQLVVASPAKKWEKILEHYYSDKTSFPEPDAKLSYEGGLVKVYPGLYTNCAKIDVSGMYPSIQKVYNLKSRKDVDGIYLSVLNFLTSERGKLKAEYKRTGSLKYNAMQNAYKILNNGGYGFSGTGGYPFNCMKTAALVTAYGRLIVQRMIDILVELGCQIIEVDTDGIYFSGDNQVKVYEKVQQALPKGIGIELEHQGVDIYSPMMKNYIIFDGNEITVKGSKFKSRTKCKLLKEFVPEYVNFMRTDRQLADKYYQDIVSDLQNHTFDLEKLKVKQRIPVNNKSLVEAGIGKPGDVVVYYHTGTVTKRGCVKSVPTQTEPYLAEYYVKEVAKLKQQVDEIVTTKEELVLV